MLGIFVFCHLLLSKKIEFMTFLPFLSLKKTLENIFLLFGGYPKISLPKWPIFWNNFLWKTINVVCIYLLTLFTKTKSSEQIKCYVEAWLLGPKSLFTSNEIFFIWKNQSLIWLLSQCKIKTLFRVAAELRGRVIFINVPLQL